MKIGYNKTLGSILLAFSLFNCLVAVVFVRSGAMTIPGFIFFSFWCGVLLGFLYLTQTYVQVAGNELVVRTVIGLTSRRYKFTSPKDFALEGGQIFLLDQGKRQKLPVYPWLANRKDWKYLVQWIKVSA